MPGKLPYSYNVACPAADCARSASKAEVVHDWIARNLPDRPHPTFSRPINWLRVGATIVIVLGSVTGAFVAWPYALPIIQNRNVWAAVSLIAILLFISGHMFNHIRHVPYVQGDGRGGINYFAGGFQNQFGLETQIVAAIYGVLSFCTIALAVKVPRIEDKKTQQAAVIGWGGLLFVMYSFLLSAFRIKNGGYPFSLPPFM
jgi:oligosaccharyltransferase complex subunit gamma